MREIILIHVTGPDRPGLTARLTSVLDRRQVDILDMGQAVIHESLNLGMLVLVPDTSSSAGVFKDLLFTSHELGVNIRFTPVEEDSYEKWVEAQGKKRHIVTLLARKISAAQIARLSALLAENGLNIDIISRLSGRVSLLPGAEPPRHGCVEFSVRGEPRDISGLRASFLDMAHELGVDIAFQEDNAFRRNRRLIAFDMDSTLVQAEGIDELAKAAGAGERVAAITEAAMRGEMDFRESLRRRLEQLAGLPETALAEIAERLPLTEGAERLIANLKRFGYKIAIISGGFTYFGQRLKDRLGVDYLFANELEIRDGRLTGRVVGDIVDGPKKAESLARIAEAEGLSLQQTIAVGDGANDLPMLNIAGLGIAFHAKPKVKAGAEHSISTLGLDAILYLVGLRQREML